MRGSRLSLKKLSDIRHSLLSVNNNESIQMTLSRREDGDGVGGKEFCFGDSSTIAKHQSEQTGSLLAV